MTPQEILQRAIEKAEGNGFNQSEPVRVAMSSARNDDGITIHPKYWNLHLCAPLIIFDHKFAKAFWGEAVEFCDACHRKHHGSFSDCDCGVGDNQEAWKFHLQQMVLEENPITYLEQFL